MATSLEYILQGTATTLLSTELNALGTGSFSAAGSAINNVQATSNFNGYTNAYLELFIPALGVGTQFAANSALYVWFLKSIDGTNYEDTSANPRPPDVIIPLETVTNTAQRIVMDIKLPPGQWKPMAENVQGSGTQALAGTLNTLKCLPYTYQGV